jgi:hypothetical protein
MPARPRHVPVLVSALLAVGLVAQDAAERALARNLDAGMPTPKPAAVDERGK